MVIYNCMLGLFSGGWEKVNFYQRVHATTATSFGYFLGVTIHSVS